MGIEFYPDDEPSTGRIKVFTFSGNHGRAILGNFGQAVLVKESSESFGDKDDDPEADEEQPNKKNEVDSDKTLLSYTFSSGSFTTFQVVTYVIQQFIKRIADDFMLTDVAAKQSIEIDCGVEVEIETMCRYTFCIDNKIYCLNTFGKGLTNHLTSRHDLTTLVDMLKKEIKNHNPLQQKHLQLQSDGNGGITWSIKPKPTTLFSNLVMNEIKKEQLIDNTVFHLLHMDCNNGIILHGPPGTGKSFACQAIIADCLKEGFSTCFVTTAVNFTALDDLISTLLGSCLVVLEDVDSYATSRELMPNQTIASFLQFLSGLTERSDRIVVVATTNHLDKLDDAVGNRPMRFNAKFLFDYPNEDEINWLVDYYFGADQTTPAQKALCCGKKFTGSHIRAMRDRAIQLEKKHIIKQQSCDGIFHEAFDFILEQFPPDKKERPGFKLK